MKLQSNIPVVIFYNNNVNFETCRLLHLQGLGTGQIQNELKWGGGGGRQTKGNRGHMVPQPGKFIVNFQCL